MYIKTYINFVVTFQSLKFFVVTSLPSTSTSLTLLPPPQPLDDKHDRVAVTSQASSNRIWGPKQHVTSFSPRYVLFT